MRKKGKFHGSLLSAVMILVILFTALGEKGISAKAETSEKEEVKEQIEEKRNRIRNAYFPEADVVDRSAKEDVAVQSAEEAKTVYVECGRVIYYSGYSTNYFEAEGNSAWCLEPARGTPQSGNYTAVKLENTSDLARALYYSVAAPGEAALYQWYGSEGYWQIGDVKQGAAVAGFDERYCYSHMFLSWVYNAFDFDAAFYGTNLKRQEYYEDLKKAFQKKVEEIRALAVPDQGFCAYVINGGNGKQVMGGWTYVPHGKAKLKKSSKEPQVTEQNPAYRLNGAVYGVYTDAGCKNLTGTLTTDENGMTQELTVSPGQYYIKEKSCPTGYALDDTVYPICVLSGQTAMIEVSDIPQKNPVSLILQKKDADTGKCEASGHATLEGAEFEIRYYKGLYEEDPAKKGMKAERIWLMRTDASGKITFDPEHKVSGDAFFELSDGEAAFPLGTVTIRETKAPDGYLTKDEVVVRKILPEGTAEAVCTYEPVEVAEQVIRGDIELIKFREDTDPETEHKTPLEGIEFSLTAKSTGEVFKIVTDEKGYATTKQSGENARGNLVYDTYTVHEINPPQGMKPVQDFEVTISEEGQTFYYLLEDKQIVSPVRLVKKDAVTGKTIRVKGAKFELLDDEKKVITMKSYYPEETEHTYFETGEDGMFLLPEKLKPGTYYFREIEAPYGYLLGEDVAFEIREGHNWAEPVTVEFYDEPLMGKLEIIKTDADTGDVLEGLVAAHAASTSGQEDLAVHVVVPALLQDDGGQGLEGTLDNALGADVFPRSGGVLGKDGQVLVLQVIEPLPGGLHDVGGGHHNTGGQVVGLEHGHGHAGLDDQSLVVLQVLQRLDDGVVRLPVTGALAVAAVDDQHLGDLGVLHVVLQHPQDGLLLPTLAPQGVGLVKATALSLYLIQDLGLLRLGGEHVTTILRHNYFPPFKQKF